VAGVGGRQAALAGGVIGVTVASLPVRQVLVRFKAFQSP
jgi:hypothetical protein